MLELFWIRLVKWLVENDILFNNWKYITEFEIKLDEFSNMELEINGIKNRTAKGYAVKDCAVWWLFQTFPNSMESKGYKWDQYMEVKLDGTN